MDKIAVLTPCYNESMTIEKVIHDFNAELPEAIIYVYGNNSSDGTDKKAHPAGATVRYEHKQRKGNVIRHMFREIDRYMLPVMACMPTFRAGQKTMSNLIAPLENVSKITRNQ